MIDAVVDKLFLTVHFKSTYYASFFKLVFIVLLTSKVKYSIVMLYDTIR